MHLIKISPMPYLIAQPGLISNSSQSARDHDPNFIGCNHFLLYSTSNGARKGHSIWCVILGTSNKPDQLSVVNGILGINEFKLPVNLEKNYYAGFCRFLFHTGSSRRTVKSNSSDSTSKPLACGEYAYMG